MDEKLRLQQMIERFMAAETSEAEERELAAYFCENDDVPAEWREYAILFRGLGGYRRRAVAPRSKRRRWAVAAAAAVITRIPSVFHVRSACSCPVMKAITSPAP